ncbi:glycosyltransferase family 4 protein [Clostridium perfringens]|uniref:glycosyltransferase family 4 protein n=1 Tax=Clostridium perfringens TaxID=1502 RepID=UPI0006693D81|nr:glycosyltransferase family 4 protein [Clostridium perfringens]MDK0671358.1 glycosyltransferase family 4 protein [Clostridium perfringens]
MKRLLVFSAYYEPEIASSLYLSSNLYEDFSRNGWKVDLFVPIPTRGVDDATRKYYKSHKIENKENLTIHRVSLMREGKGTIGRAFRYILMNIIFIYKGLTTKADAIFVQSTPPTQGAMAAIIKKIKKIPFVYNLQDIFPDSMITMGMITKKSVIYKFGRIIENFTYKNADKIIVISNDMKKNLIKKGVLDDKISVISNWIETDIVKPIKKSENYIYDKFNLNPNDFHVVYAGNLGYAQNIEVIINAAKFLEEYKKIKFVIFGKGTQEEKYKNMASKLKSKNIIFLPIQPYDKVAYVYSLGDASIVSCKKGFGGSAMPSKTWNIMASGTPVLASFDAGTDMEKIILLNKLGLFSDANDIDSLVNNIKYLYLNKKEAKSMGENARMYAKLNVSRNLCTKQYIEIINNI